MTLSRILRFQRRSSDRHRPTEAPNRPYRVGFVSHTGMDGGAQRSMVDLIDALTARGVEVRVVVPEEGYVSSALEARSIPYLVYRYWPWTREIRLPWWDRFLKKPLVHLLRAVKLSRSIRQWRCHVIVSNTLTVCEGALAARILRLPHVTYVREFGDLDHDYHFEWGPRLSMRLLSLLSARVVFNSRALARHYRRQASPAKSRVIYNAVSVPSSPLAPDEIAEPRPPGTTFSAVLVGYLIPGKGHEDAIRAIAHLLDRGLRVNLKIVGGGPGVTYTRSLDELIESLGVSGLVEIVGQIPDPQMLFRQADVALMCSRTEAFGRVTVEAMKLGTPVIGTRSGGTPEVIRDRYNGLLYTPGDARDLAAKIEQLAQDPASAKRMGEQAKRFATEMFSLDRYGNDFLNLLREIVEVRARREAGWTSVRAWFTRQRQTHILVVDDDPLVAQWLAASLATEGHDVDVASNGRAALEQLERASYDLILSDLRMPELDGIALYRFLERERPQAARRMLFLTGWAEMAQYREFLVEKRDRTLTKPVDFDELNRAARRILALQTK